MNKFWYLTKSSLKKKIGTKWFLITNIILFIVVAGIININSIIKVFGGKSDNSLNVYVVDNASVYSYFKKTLSDIDEDKVLNISLKKSKEDLVKNIQDEDVIIVINEDENEYLKSEIISNDKIDSNVYQNIVNALSISKAALGMIKENINIKKLLNITSEVSIDRTILKDDKSVGENMDMIMNSVFPTVILPFFTLVIILIQMVGGEICEEKTTRSMEIIISNVSPKKHLFSKILAGNIFVIVQGLLLIVYALIGLFINKTLTGVNALNFIGEIVGTVDLDLITQKLIILIPFTIVLMILSFIGYAVLSGILASMTVNIEDFNQLQTPIMLVTMVGYYLSITASMFNGSTLIHILSYIPFLSAFLSPTLYIIGDISVYEMIVSIIVMAGFIYLLISKGIKVYKNGILNYSNDKVWDRFKRIIKN